VKHLNIQRKTRDSIEPGVRAYIKDHSRPGYFRRIENRIWDPVWFQVAVPVLWDLQDQIEKETE